MGPLDVLGGERAMYLPLSILLYFHSTPKVSLQSVKVSQEKELNGY
jgi:hypothetical protein